MRGFRNLGDTCYLNAALQCLLHAPQMSNYFLSEHVTDDLQRKRLNACAVAAEYAALTLSYWRPRDSPGEPPPPLDPSALRAALAKVHRPFGRPGPQDAHEATVVLLKTLHEALARTRSVRQGVAAPHVDAGSWDAHNKGNYSILTEIFQGQLECVVAGEGYRSVTHQHFWDLTLAVDDVGSVPAAVTRYLTPETVSGYRLDDGRDATVTVRRSFVYLPLVLVVCLNRFDARRMKCDKFVNYDVELDLSSTTPRNATYRYALFAVCLHSGDRAADGHYSALVEHRGAWRYANDESCTPVTDPNALIQRDAYVLFYKRDLSHM